MSGFNTRVMLLQKWAPNLLPQLKDSDDLADIILDVWDEAEAYAEQRIVKLLEDNYWHDIYYPPQENYVTKPAEELETAHREYCIGCQLVALIKEKNEAN